MERVLIQSKRKKRVLFFILALFLIVSAGIVTWMKASGFWDSSAAVHVKDKDIENSTLAIGTHLIYLGSMTDELYELATASAEESSQQNIYYKSELADGVWYDITDAGSLLDITTDGKVVSADVIEELFFEYHTKSDGVTYDLRNNQSICIFDLNDPYDLWNMEELLPLRTQYSIFNERDELSKSDEINKDSCDLFWATDVQNERTKEYDEQLQALQKYFEQLTAADGDPDMIDMVEKIMGKVDSARRALVFKQLHDDDINVLLSRLEGKNPGKESNAEGTVNAMEDNEEGEEDSEFQVDTELVTSASDSQGNLNDSLLTHQNNMLTEGDTLFSRVEYKYGNSLIQHAKDKDYASCDGDVAALIALNNINEEIVIDPESEVKILDDELIRQSEASFLAGLSAGVSSDYATAKQNKLSVAVLNSYLTRQQTDVSGKLSEFEYYLSAKIERITDEQAKEMLNQRLSDIGAVYDVIQADEFQSSATIVVDDYKLWLMDTLSELLSGEGDAELEKLQADYEAAKANYQEALDVGDLQAAKKYGAELEAIQGKIDDAEQRYVDILTGEGSTDAEKAAAEAMLSDDSAAKQIVELKKEAEKALNDGNLTDLNAALDGIGALAASNPDLAKSALDDLTKQVAQKMMETDSTSDDGKSMLKDLNDSLNKIADIAAENSSGLFGDTTEQEIVEKIVDGLDQSLLGDDASLSDVKSFDDLFGLLAGSGSQNGDSGSSNSAKDDSGKDDSDKDGSDKDGSDKDGSGKDDSDKDSGGNDSSGESGSDSSTLPNVVGVDQLNGQGLEQSVVVGVALARYFDEFKTDGAYDGRLNDFLDTLFNQKNPYVYRKPDRKSKVFVPTENLAACLNYRYVFNQTQKKATLAKDTKSTVYEFRAFSNIVKKTVGKEVTENVMTNPTKFRKMVYVDVDYLESEFECSAVYIKNTSYGVILTNDMNDEVTKLLDLLISE